MQNFQVIRWAAWAQGLESQVAWQEWLRCPSPIAAKEPAQAKLQEMPAMMRRRVDPLGRAAMQAAYWAQAHAAIDGPVVFASRWGELARSVLLLQQLAHGEALSPTQFSLSVHNANSALYSMARQDRQNYMAVAAGEHSVEAGVCEALGLLADGAQQVLLVYCDAPLPPAYAALRQVDIAPMPYAWACVMETAIDGQGLHLQALPSRSGATSIRHALGELAPLHFLVNNVASLERSVPQGRWLWTRGQRP